MFKKQKYQRYDTDRMQTDIDKLTKEFQRLGDSQGKARENAEKMVMYYKHTYRKKDKNFQ